MHSIIPVVKIVKEIKSLIMTSIIDVNNLEVYRLFFHHVRETLMRRLYNFFFIVAGHNYRHYLRFYITGTIFPLSIFFTHILFLIIYFLRA